MQENLKNIVDQSQEDDSNMLPEQAFLMDAAMMLHQYGTPAYRLERLMGRLAVALNVKAEFLYTPTSLLIAFKKGLHRTWLKRIEPASPQLGKLIDFDNVLDRLTAGEIDLETAHQQIKTIDSAPNRYPFWATMLAYCLASACVAILLGGGVFEALFAGTVGAAIVSWDRLLQTLFPQEHLLEITAGFLAAAAAIVVGFFLPSFDQSTALLGSLIVIVPGYSFTVAVAELANRHLSCGVARLAGSLVTFLGLVLGVTLAWRLLEFWRLAAQPETVAWLPLGSTPTYLLALIVAPFALAILFEARFKDWAVIALVTWAGAAATVLVTQQQSAQSGAFAGALAVGIASNLYARFFDRPASVTQMPATLLLVPGSLGYKSLTAFAENNQAEGIEIGFNMSFVAIAIVGGLLTANLIVPPKRIL